MATKFKHLTDSDIEYLKNELHESQENIAQIDDFCSHMKITVDGKKSSLTKVREKLPQDVFLSCLDRATFHCSTSCEGNDGSSISFDTYQYWSTKRKKYNELEQLFKRYEADPGILTTDELEKLAKDKWITKLDLWSNLTWDAGICENEISIEDQAKKSDLITFDSILYGYSEKDSTSQDFMYDDYIWLDCIPTSYNKKTREFSFDTSKLTKKEKELFGYVQDILEYRLKNNLKENYSCLFESKTRN